MADDWPLARLLRSPCTFVCLMSRFIEVKYLARMAATRSHLPGPALQIPAVTSAMQ
jgi:hypothetical protein